MDPDEKALVRQSLLDWKNQGVANPTIPMFDDVNLDGVPDYYGLDENDEVTIVLGGSLESSVFESTGDEEAE